MKPSSKNLRATRKIRRSKNDGSAELARLRRAAAELAQIYETAPIGMALHDVKLRYVRINQMLADFNGRSVADHIGRTLAEVIPDIASRVESVFRKVIRTKRAVLNMKVYGPTPANPGEEKYWVASFYPFLDKAGVVQGVSVIVQDVTKEMKAKRSLQRVRKTLRNRVINLLSLRELEVFKLSGLGMATSAIAKKLKVSVKTVETHRARVQKKLGLKSYVEVVREASRWLENAKR